VIFFKETQQIPQQNRYNAMKNTFKNRAVILTLFFWILFSGGCTSLRLEGGSSPGNTKTQKTVVTTFFAQPKLDTLCARYPNKAMSEVTIRTNAFYSFVTIITLGILYIFDVEYICAPEPSNIEKP
jgi:hypothetical protein